MALGGILDGLARAGSAAFGGYQRGKMQASEAARAEEELQRRREAEMRQERRQRINDLRGRSRDKVDLDMARERLRQLRNPAPEVPEYDVDVDGMRGTFTDPDEAASFREKYTVPEEPKVPAPQKYDVNADGIRTEFTDPEAARKFRDEYGRQQERSRTVNPLENPYALKDDEFDPVGSEVQGMIFNRGGPPRYKSPGLLGGAKLDPTMGPDNEGDPNDAFDRPDLGKEFKALMVMNAIRQQLRVEHPEWGREEIEAEVRRRITEAGR